MIEKAIQLMGAEMLIEALTYLITPATPLARRLGYLREVIATGARHKRCRSAWAPHVKNSHEAILAAVDQAATPRHVVILGSGNLIDVPIEALMARAGRVDLVDMVHPLCARRCARRHPNLAVVTADVTGMAAAMDLWLRSGDGPPPTPGPPDLLANSAPDLVISLNILSQLAVLFEEKAEKQGFSAALGDDFRDAVMRSHINWLDNLSCPVLLLADRERLFLTGDTITEREAAQPAGLLPEPQDTWSWDIAPVGEAGPDTAIRHVVGSWYFDKH